MYKVQKYRVSLVKDGRARVTSRQKVACSDDAIALFQSVMRGLPHEEVWLGLCNGQNEVTGLVRIAQGGMHGCALTPSDVFRPVIAAGANGFVMAHNHPSGDPTPSEADVEITRRMLEAGELLGIRLLDHVILTWGGASYSMNDRTDELRGLW